MFGLVFCLKEIKRLKSILTPLRFSLQSFLLAKYMRHTFSVYATLILGLGAMFTSSYRIQDFSVNTAICGKMPTSAATSKDLFRFYCRHSLWFVLLAGVLMILVTIVSFIHLITACLHPPRPITPVAEPWVKFNGCETVCQPDGGMKNKLQC